MRRSENSNCLHGTRPTVNPRVSSPDEGCLDQMLGEKPCLLFACADHVRDDEVVGPVVAERTDSRGRIMRIDQYQLMRLEQSGEHGWDLLAAVGRPRHTRDLSGMTRVADRDAAQSLDPLSYHIDELELLARMLVEKQVQLAERRTAHQLVMLLVERMQDLGICENPVQTLARV